MFNQADPDDDSSDFLLLSIVIERGPQLEVSYIYMYHKIMTQVRVHAQTCIKAICTYSVL